MYKLFNQFFTLIFGLDLCFTGAETDMGLLD